MRKVAGVLFSAAMVLPLAVMVSPAGSAAAKPTCKAASGTATFTPPLPKIKDPKLVKPTIKITGTLTGCTGGGVTSAKIAATLKQAIAGNCTTLLAGKTANIAGTETLTWNTKATSTIALKLTGVTGKATQTSATGKVTKGLFIGGTQGGITVFAPVAGGCTTAPLAKVTFKQQTAFTIK